MNPYSSTIIETIPVRTQSKTAIRLSPPRVLLIHRSTLLILPLLHPSLILSILLSFYPLFTLLLLVSDPSNHLLPFLHFLMRNL